MKKLSTLIVLFLFSLNSTYAQSTNDLFDTAQGILTTDKSKDTLSTVQADSSDKTPSAFGILSKITESLNVTDSQAEGGLGSLFEYAKSNLSGNDFNQLASLIPGINTLINEAPEISGNNKESSGFGSLLNKAAEYSSTVSAANDLNKQFESLGLSTEMIIKFANTTLTYLDTEEGQQARQLLQNAFSSLISE